MLRYTFDESAHPRKGEGPGGGQFTAGAGGSSSAADDDDDGGTFRLKPRADVATEVGMPQLTAPTPAAPTPPPTPAPATRADQWSRHGVLNSMNSHI